VQNGHVGVSYNVSSLNRHVFDKGDRLDLLYDGGGHRLDVDKLLPRVHLDVKPSVALERVRKRARPCEACVTLEYLTALHDVYEDFIVQLGKEVPVLRFSTTVGRHMPLCMTRERSRYVSYSSDDMWPRSRRTRAKTASS
jgi:hypothetical protein